METEATEKPVARVTGIYRGTFDGLTPLTPTTPLSPEEVRRNPIFYQLDLNPDMADENLIIDVIYDDLAPIRLPDLRRGTDMPHGVRFWMDWFDIPHYELMHDLDGRAVYPRMPGIHTIRIMTGRRKWAQIGRLRDFWPQNGGYISETFRFRIAGV